MVSYDELNNRLYTKLKNHLFTALCDIIQDMLAGVQYSEADIKKRLKQNMQGHAGIDAHIDQICSVFFDIDAKTQTATLNNPKPLPLHQPMLLELVCLKELLSNPSFSFLITSPHIRQVISEYKKEIPPATWKKYEPLIPPSILEKNQPVGDDPALEPLHTCLTRFQQALLLQVQISYQQKTSKNPVLSEKACPFRLKYDLASNTYTYILYSQKLHDFIFYKASDIISIELHNDIPNPQNLPDLFNAFLNRHLTSVTLKLKRKWNAVERCFLLFSSYDKETTVDETLDIYTLTIFYYDFDTNEILNKIISLGNAVTVIQPPQIRNRIIERLKKTYQWYQ